VESDIKDIPDMGGTLARATAEQIAAMIKSVFGPSGASADEARECWEFELGEHFDPRAWWQGWYLAQRVDLLVLLPSGRWVASAPTGRGRVPTAGARVIAHLTKVFGAESFTRHDAVVAMATEEHDRPLSQSGIYRVWPDLVETRAIVVVPVKRTRVAGSGEARFRLSGAAPGKRPVPDDEPELVGEPEVPAWMPDPYHHREWWAIRPDLEQDEDTLDALQLLVFLESFECVDLLELGESGNEREFDPVKVAAVHGYRANTKMGQVPAARAAGRWSPERVATALQVARGLGLVVTTTEDQSLRAPHRIHPDVDSSIWMDAVLDDRRRKFEQTGRVY
jgi:hypothetical protein